MRACVRVCVNTKSLEHSLSVYIDCVCVCLYVSKVNQTKLQYMKIAQILKLVIV